MIATEGAVEIIAGSTAFGYLNNSAKLFRCMLGQIWLNDALLATYGLALDSERPGEHLKKRRCHRPRRGLSIPWFLGITAFSSYFLFNRYSFMLKHQTDGNAVV